MSDGFLARWSRRKRDEARRAPEIAPEAAPAGSAAAPEDDGSLSPEELAQLPSLDALTAATDLTPFLRAGVPRALRNAALRRMWSVDPAIRDFVSEAREYAYDWNTPGGVPGTGGLISAEEVRAMVERVFGGGGETPAPVADESGVAGDVALSSSPGQIPGSPGTCKQGSKPGEPDFGRGAGRASLAGDTASPEGGGEEAFPEEALPAPPPHRRLPPRPVDDEEGDPRSPGALSPTAGGDGGRQPLASSPPAEGIPRPSPGRGEPAAEPEPSSPSPPRLRRHGGAIPI